MKWTKFCDQFVSDTSDSRFTCRTVTDTARYTKLDPACPGPTAATAAATTATAAAATTTAKWTETISGSAHNSITGTFLSSNYCKCLPHPRTLIKKKRGGGRG